MTNTSLVFKKYNNFTTEELVAMLVTGVLAGFYLSFDDWGVDGYDYMIGMQNFLLATFAVLLILATILIAQKFLGAMYGYQIRYESSWVGLLTGFFVTILSYGALPFFLLGGISYKLIKTARLGKFLHSYKHSEMFITASMAVIIPLFFALVFGGFFVATENIIFQQITIAALLSALYSLLPLPHLTSPHTWNLHGVSEIRFIKHLRGGTYGYDLFSFSLTTYVLLAVTTLVFAGLVLLFQIFSIVLAVLLALLILFVYKIAIPYLNK